MKKEVGVYVLEADDDDARRCCNVFGKVQTNVTMRTARFKRDTQRRKKTTMPPKKRC